MPFYKLNRLHWNMWRWMSLHRVIQDGSHIITPTENEKKQQKSGFVYQDFELIFSFFNDNWMVCDKWCDSMNNRALEIFESKSCGYIHALQLLEEQLTCIGQPDSRHLLSCSTPLTPPCSEENRWRKRRKVILWDQWDMKKGRNSVWPSTVTGRLKSIIMYTLHPTSLHISSYNTHQLWSCNSNNTVSTHTHTHGTAKLQSWPLRLPLRTLPSPLHHNHRSKEDVRALRVNQQRWQMTMTSSIINHHPTVCLFLTFIS